MADFTPTIGIGVADLQLAASREARRIMAEANGDLQVASKLLLEKIRDLGFISDSEFQSLSKVSEIGFESSRGNIPPEKAYAEVHSICDQMIAGGQANPTALVLASGAAGSYMSIEEVAGQPTVVFKKTASSWEDTLGKAGLLLGAAIGGGAGAAIGGAVGGVAGRIVDECLD